MDKEKRQTDGETSQTIFHVESEAENPEQKETFSRR